MKDSFKVVSPVRLKDFDPDFHDGMEKDEAREKTAKLCNKIGELQELLYANARQAVVLLFQGMDTSGKDGTVRRVLEFCVSLAGVERPTSNPCHARSARTTSSGASTSVPRYGRIGVFNRSHYEDVLVVRAGQEPGPGRSVARPRYDHINAFEQP